MRKNYKFEVRLLLPFNFDAVGADTKYVEGTFDDEGAKKVKLIKSDFVLKEGHKYWKDESDVKPYSAFETPDYLGLALEITASTLSIIESALEILKAKKKLEKSRVFVKVDKDNLIEIQDGDTLEGILKKAKDAKKK
jgi:hypothetical protein